jgi:hypothetical protein
MEVSSWHPKWWRNEYLNFNFNFICFCFISWALFLPHLFFCIISSASFLLHHFFHIVSSASYLFLGNFFHFLLFLPLPLFLPLLFVSSTSFRFFHFFLFLPLLFILFLPLHFFHVVLFLPLRFVSSLFLQQSIFFSNLIDYSSKSNKGPNLWCYIPWYMAINSCTKHIIICGYLLKTLLSTFPHSLSLLLSSHFNPYFNLTFWIPHFEHHIIFWTLHFALLLNFAFLYCIQTCSITFHPCFYLWFLLQTFGPSVPEACGKVEEMNRQKEVTKEQGQALFKVSGFLVEYPFKLLREVCVYLLPNTTTIF